jgi:branched-chain amino acid transport system substrate-binding protein
VIGTSGPPGVFARLAGAAVLALWCGVAAAQVGDAEIVFGMAGPFSGPSKELGLHVRTGIEVAFASQNEAGGVHGRKLRLVSMDDGFEPTRTTAAMKELVETRKVFAVIGNVGTATAAVAVPYANEKGVILFGTVSGASLLRQRPPDRYVFNVRASYAEETAAIVRHLVEVKRVRPERIAVFAQDDTFGSAGFDGVSKAMRHYGRDPAKVLRVRYKRNTTDVDDAVRVIAGHAKELGAVVMIASYKPATRFIEKLHDAGVHQLVFTNVSDVGANELADELSQLGAGYAEGVIVTQVVPLPTSSATPILKYREQLKKHAPGEKPGFLSLESWLSARLLIEGLQRAGRELNTDRLIAALEGIQSLDIGIGTPLAFGPSEHQASHLVWATVLDGKGVPQLLALE